MWNYLTYEAHVFFSVSSVNTWTYNWPQEQYLSSFPTHPNSDLLLSSLTRNQRILGINHQLMTYHDPESTDVIVGEVTTELSYREKLIQ